MGDGVWGMGAGIQEIAAVAGWGDAQLEFARDRISDEGRAEDLNKGKAPAQVRKINSLHLYVPRLLTGMLVSLYSYDVIPSSHHLSNVLRCLIVVVPSISS